MNYDNKVIGNRPNDNKDPKNRQTLSSSSKAEYFRPQNSPNHTPPGPDQNGDKGIKMQANRAKKIIRKDTSYTDGAIARAKLIRGM